MQEHMMVHMVQCYIELNMSNVGFLIWTTDMFHEVEITAELTEADLTEEGK